MAPTNGTSSNGNGSSAVPKPRAEWIAKRRAANSDGNFSQMRYARRGVVTEEMEYIAFREKQPVELIRDEVARGTNDHSRQHQPSRTRADGDRRRLALQDQREHRQLGGDFE